MRCARHIILIEAATYGYIIIKIFKGIGHRRFPSIDGSVNLKQTLKMAFWYKLVSA